MATTNVSTTGLEVVQSGVAASVAVSTAGLEVVQSATGAQVRVTAVGLEVVRERRPVIATGYKMLIGVG